MDSLAAELEKLALPALPEEPADPKQPEGNEGQENQEPENGGEAQQNPQPETPEAPQNTDNGDSPFQPILEKFGRTEPVEIKTLDDLERVVDEYVAAQEERYSIFNHPDVKAVAEYIKGGGSIADYQAKPQPSNRFQDITFADDADAQAEKFITDFYSEQGHKPAAIKGIINAYKEEGNLIVEARELAEVLSTKEKEYNDNLAAQEQQELADRQAEMQTFFTGITEAYDKPLNGVTASKELVAEAKAKSLPNKEGVIEIFDIIDKFTPQQHAMLNMAALAISGKKEFRYSPAQQAAKPRTNPIDQLIGKSGGAATEFGSIADLEGAVAKLKQ